MTDLLTCADCRRTVAAAMLILIRVGDTAYCTDCRDVGWLFAAAEAADATEREAWQKLKVVHGA